jgi:membrane-bound metal-dependent hydrolase YbcI (DUF457 family)
MFIGHFAPAIALAARKDAPGMAMLCVAAQLTDIGFMLFVIFGVEHLRIVPGITKMVPFDLYHMPYTHSLLGTAVFAAAFAVLVACLAPKHLKRAMGAIAAFVVLSHWFLDVLVHRPDMTFLGRDAPVGFGPIGFGLWNYPAIEMTLEVGMVLVAVWLYNRATVPINARGKFTLWLFLGFLLESQAINWFGPPPETAIMVPLMALPAYVLTAVAAFYVQRSRRHL